MLKALCFIILNDRAENMKAFAEVHPFENVLFSLLTATEKTKEKKNYYVKCTRITERGLHDFDKKCYCNHSIRNCLCDFNIILYCIFMQLSVVSNIRLKHTASGMVLTMESDVV